ncbi:MAG: hypothetical protein JF619_21395 [Massilia sp.]|nr:hypothetical protein [Massilia sp.]
MRRPYLIASLAAHAALLALLYYYGAYEPNIAAQERQLGESRLLDRHAEMRRHVADMEQIEALMRASEGKADDAAPAPVRFDATTAESPDDLLARAEALSKKIDAMGEQARVDDYAAITGQDKEKAAAQLEASTPTRPIGPIRRRNRKRRRGLPRRGHRRRPDRNRQRRRRPARLTMPLPCLVRGAARPHSPARARARGRVWKRVSRRSNNMRATYWRSASARWSEPGAPGSGCAHRVLHPRRHVRRIHRQVLGQ